MASSSDRTEGTTRRTRAHRIADLSRHHFEGFALRRGHTVAIAGQDYGYDLWLSTYDYSGGGDGLFENELIYIQLKATDRPTLLADGETVALRVRREHLNLWRRAFLPVILVVYDASNDRAYWLHVQPYLRSSGSGLMGDQGSVTAHIPRTNVLNEDAIEEFRRLKIECLRSVPGWEGVQG